MPPLRDAARAVVGDPLAARPVAGWDSQGRADKRSYLSSTVAPASSSSFLSFSASSLSTPSKMNRATSV